MTHTIHVGDCLEWLRSLPDNSVDSVVTDPPYGLGKEPDAREVLRAWLDGEEYKPGGSGFMGRAWDAFVPSPPVWAECLRVLKPGGHLLAFAGTRTYDWIVMGVRLAGFEVRDMLGYLYGTGFPKSLNIRKQPGIEICTCGGRGNAVPCDHDKQTTEHRMRSLRGSDLPETVNTHDQRGQVLLTGMSKQGAPGDGSAWSAGVHDGGEKPSMEGRGVSGARQGVQDDPNAGTPESETERIRSGALVGCGEYDGPPIEPRRSGAPYQRESVGQSAGEPKGVRIAPGSLGDGASSGHHRCPHCERLKPEYVGFGSALKPSIEPVVMARKPLSGTVAANVLEWGTGGINVDGCRVQTDESTERPSGVNVGIYGSDNRANVRGSTSGRWPANIIHDGSPEVLAVFPVTTSGALNAGHKRGTGVTSYSAGGGIISKNYGNDTGSAARFYYAAKASRAEREHGLDALPRGIVDPTRAEDSAGRDNPRAGAGRSGSGRANIHPTVKPVDLMRYLLRLVTPPGGLTIDPYAGSGTTGVAAVHEGFRFKGCELETPHALIAVTRIAQAVTDEREERELATMQQTLF